MYCNHFGLHVLPFEERADAQFLFPTAECEEALAALEYEIQYGTGLGLLVGEAGTGKTLLIRTLLPRLAKSDQAIVLTWPPSGAMDLIRECCKGLGVTLPSSHNQTRRLNRLRRHLGRSAGAGHRSILIVDQAENLSPSNIAQLATLADLYGDRGKLLTILLAAQPQVRSLLDRPDFARIRQQLFGERMLSPLTETGTREYIRHRLRIAGAGDADLFDDRAVGLIHEISGGVPRLINRICSTAMLTAYGAQAPRITCAIVEEATSRPAMRERTVSARELGLPAAADGGAPWLDAPQTEEPAEEPDDSRVAPDLYEPSLAGAAGADGTAGTDGTDGNGIDEAWSEENQSGGASIADAGYHGFDGVPLKSDPSNGPALLARLERATAHAERMMTTTEASLTRLAAVEKHLASLIEHADRITECLSPAAQRKVEAIERAERRFADVASRAERQAGAAEARLAGISETVTQTADSAARAERACELAREVESRLTASAERLADKADEVQQRVAALMSGTQTTDDAQTQLTRLIGQAASEAQTFDDTLNTFRSQMHATLQVGERELERRVAAQIEGCERHIQEWMKNYERSAQAAVGTAQGKLDSVLQRASAATAQGDVAIERHRTAMRDEFASLEASARNAVESAQTKLDAVLRHAAAAAADAERRVDAVVAPLQAAIADGERFEKQLTDTLPRRCREEIDALSESFRTALRSELASVEKAARQTTDSLQTRLNDVLSQASSAAADVESAMAAASAETQSNASSVAELSETVRNTRSLVDQLDIKAQTLTHTLADTVQRGEQLLAEVQVTADRTTALQQQVANSLVDIGIGCERVTTVRAQVGDCDQLVAAHERAQAAAKQLNAMVASAAQTLDALQGLVAHADEKVDRLGSHHAAASHILERLSAANVAGHQVVQRIEESGHVAEDSAARADAQIGRLTEDVLSVNTMTETVTKRLDDKHKEAADLLASLTASSASTTGLIEELARHTAQAREHTQQMTEGAGQAGELVAQLSAITQVLAAAREVGVSLHQSVEEARSLAGRLGAIGEEAAPRTAALDEMNAVARELIDKQEQLREEAGSAAERLEHQLATAMNLTDANGGLLRDFTTCADSLREQIDELSRRASEMESRLAVLAAGPTAIVESAQTQAAQLEKVCSAVRKIFANLSEATLKAQRQTEELKGAGAGTAARLSQLTAETDRATRTLHVWVEEAVRTQSRLEQTLSECPSVRQTHPTETVRRLSSAAKPFARTVVDDAGGALQVLPQPEAPAGPAETKVVRTLTRAQEIARLIEEAKRQEAVPT